MRRRIVVAGTCLVLVAWCLATVAQGASTLTSGLSTESEHSRSGYTRSTFKLWTDADADDCDTRDEVLIVESNPDAKHSASSCALSSGHWYSNYDDVKTTNASSFDIDHLVPLAEAWDSGADEWDADRREAFANDLGYAGSLIAVTASSNRSKGDRDPGEWLPRRIAYRCLYIKTYVNVKKRWALSVDKREASALNSLWSRCEKDETLGAGPHDLAGSTSPSSTPAPSTPKPTAKPSSCDASYPDFCIPPPPPDLNCGDDVGNRHNFTVRQPDLHRFDGDKDGKGCDA